MQIENYIIDITAVGDILTEVDKEKLREIFKTSTTSNELRTKLHDVIKGVVNKIPMDKFITFLFDYIELKVEDEADRLIKEMSNE